MKKILLSVILMLLAGCDYEFPLSQTPSAPANPAVAGKWIEVSTNSKSVSMEIQTSGTDYLVTYTEDDRAATEAGSSLTGIPITFKGFEIKAAGLNLIQLELKDAEKQKYLFVKYELTPEGLSVYRLNTEVVSAKCQTAEEMLNDINVHRQNPFLFKEPLKFTKSAQQ